VLVAGDAVTQHVAGDGLAIEAVLVSGTHTWGQAQKQGENRHVCMRWLPVSSRKLSQRLLWQFLVRAAAVPLTR
jgi:hypothetical protein